MGREERYVCQSGLVVIAKLGWACLGVVHGISLCQTRGEAQLFGCGALLDFVQSTGKCIGTWYIYFHDVMLKCFMMEKGKADRNMYVGCYMSNTSHTA